MLARRLPGILPPLALDEALAVTKVHSVAGRLPPGSALLTRRPFRAPHHTVSDAGLVGGGSPPRPGEVSLAHHGVLFLDELPEFRRHVLEVLRQPMEDGTVVIARATGPVRYPARILLVAAMNPCPCGRLGDGTDRCTCDPGAVGRYRSRVSGPLLDRIDLHVEVGSVPFGELTAHAGGESSAAVRARVIAARERQRARFAEVPGVLCNAHMGAGELARHARPGPEVVALLQRAVERLGLSARAYHRLLKVARTIADLDGAKRVATDHAAEAIQYRTLDRASPS
jgi:magnesium chelatase family protein